MGQAGSIAGTFTTYEAAKLGRSPTGISWLGQWHAPSGMSGGFQTAPSVDASRAAARAATTGSLFPFYRSVGTVGYGGNYVVWGGRCAGQQPPSGSTPLAGGQPRSTGGAARRPGAAALPRLRQAVDRVGQAAYVKLTYTGGGCTDSWTGHVTTATTMPTTGWLAIPRPAVRGCRARSRSAPTTRAARATTRARSSPANTSFSTTATSNSVPDDHPDRHLCEQRCADRAARRGAVMRRVHARRAARRDGRRHGRPLRPVRRS